MHSKSLILASLLLAAAVAWAWSDEANSQKTETGTAEPVRLTLRGHIVDLHAEFKKAYAIDTERDVKPIWAFKTSDGAIFTLVKTRRSAALFLDERLRQRELILKGRTFPRSQTLEATFIQSVHHGVVHDLYYYCDICSIKALTPEICACCREPVRLVEKPLKTPPEAKSSSK